MKASGRVEVHPRAVTVSEVVARAAALVRVQVSDAGLSLTMDGCEAGASVMADPDRLQQILLNLLTNAAKFTPPGGSIVITCETDGIRTRIGVRDTGIGIAPEDLPRIFSPFVQVGAAPAQSPSMAGVGLGLAISRDLAQAMHGDVTAESVPGAGSLFTIDLPAATAVGDPVSASR